MELRTTKRGFGIIEFKDRYDVECSLQMSSLATQPAIWFGVTDAEPMIMASLVQEGGKVWVKYPIHPDVHINTRMHLTQEQVRALLPHLQRFVETGEI